MNLTGYLSHEAHGMVSVDVENAGGYTSNPLTVPVRLVFASTSNPGGNAKVVLRASSLTENHSAPTQYLEISRVLSTGIILKRVLEELPTTQADIDSRDFDGVINILHVNYDQSGNNEQDFPEIAQWETFDVEIQTAGKLNQTVAMTPTIGGPDFIKFRASGNGSLRAVVPMRST